MLKIKSEFMTDAKYAQVFASSTMRDEYKAGCYRLIPPGPKEKGGNDDTKNYLLSATRPVTSYTSWWVANHVVDAGFGSTKLLTLCPVYEN